MKPDKLSFLLITITAFLTCCTSESSNRKSYAENEPALILSDSSYYYKNSTNSSYLITDKNQVTNFEYFIEDSIIEKHVHFKTKKGFNSNTIVLTQQNNKNKKATDLVSSSGIYLESMSYGFIGRVRNDSLCLEDSLVLDLIP